MPCIKSVRETTSAYSPNTEVSQMSRTEHPTLADARAKLLDYINRHLTLRGFSTSSRALHEFLAVFEAGVRDDERDAIKQSMLDGTTIVEFVAPPLGVTIGVDLGAPEVSSAPFEDSLHIQSLIDDDDHYLGAERFVASSKADDDQTGADLVAPKLNVLKKSRVVVDSK